MKGRVVILLALSGVLISCTDTAVKTIAPFKLYGRDHFYNQIKWAFTGRLAYSDADNSGSASIDWKHESEQDKIELVGPFGQGRTIISIKDRRAIVDYGGKQLEIDISDNDLVAKYTGVTVPIKALTFWVLGLVDPKLSFVSIEEGFVQSGWQIRYQKMQYVPQGVLPQKIKIEKNDSKLKLIINQWNM